MSHYYCHELESVTSFSIPHIVNDFFHAFKNRPYKPELRDMQPLAIYFQLETHNSFVCVFFWCLRSKHDWIYANISFFFVLTYLCHINSKKK